MELDLIIKGNVITVCNQQPRAEAIGIKGGRIVAVGMKKDIEAKAGKAPEVLDLSGKTILPGFIDSHAHPMGTGKNRLGVDLSSVKTVSEVLEKIRERVEKTSPGTLVFCPDYNRLTVAEKRYPTKQELDSVSTVHPIWIQHYDGHHSQINSLGIKLLDLKPGMEGVDLDSNGDITGLLNDPASARSLSTGDDFSDPNQAMEALKLVTGEAASVGITTLFAKEGLNNAEFIARNLDKIPVRIHHMILTGIDDEMMKKIAESKYLPRNICIANFADGSVEGRTAALYEPYTDDPSTLGMLHHTDQELYEIVEKVHKAGYQISIHAESDRSIDQVLQSYEKVLDKYPRKDHRHRIEHFEICTQKQIRKVARLGVALGMQPMFIPACEGPNLDYYRSLIGERVNRTHVFRSILDEEILVSGGSDSPVTHMNPLGGIHAMVNQPLVEQRVTVHEAVEVFTINGAKIGFEENEKGSIEPGKYADFAVLSEDPYRVPREKIQDIQVEMTIVGGKVVYRNQ
ncbi:MAG: amidohydrolase [Dehalococcoidales bacterium]|nr:amidohydrolase [Dehalococcoidales bacterium]